MQGFTLLSVFTARSGLSFTANTPTTATVMAAVLTVSWNCKNLEMES